MDTLLADRPARWVASLRVIDRCARWLAAATLAAAVLAGLTTSVVRAADEYFEKALDKIEQTLVRPPRPRTYGFVASDVMSDPRKPDFGALRTVYSFFTDDGKVQFSMSEYPRGEVDKDPARHT
jgi:hypothetical protein